MTRVGLSLTGELGLSLTRESAYRKPKWALTPCGCCEILPLNYANIESYGFFLTQSRARRFCRCDEFREPGQSFVYRGEVSRTRFTNPERRPDHD